VLLPVVFKKSTNDPFTKAAWGNGFPKKGTDLFTIKLLLPFDASSATYAVYGSVVTDEEIHLR